MLINGKRSLDLGALPEAVVSDYKGTFGELDVDNLTLSGNTLSGYLSSLTLTSAATFYNACGGIKLCAASSDDTVLLESNSGAVFCTTDGCRPIWLVKGTACGCGTCGCNTIQACSDFEACLSYGEAIMVEVNGCPRWIKTFTR